MLMLFANIDAINAIRDIALAAFTCFGTVFGAYMAYQMRKLNAKVEIVHKATNSLTDRLVEASALAGEQKGAEDERARALLRAESHKPEGK